jgi:hypothetical protein
MCERTFFFSEMRSPQWNDNDRGKLKDWKKNLSQCHFVHHKFHWIDPGANPSCHGENNCVKNE